MFILVKKNYILSVSLFLEKLNIFHVQELCVFYVRLIVHQKIAVNNGGLN
jgi:hypothetical protein